MSLSPGVIKMLNDLPPESQGAVEKFVQFLHEQAQKGKALEGAPAAKTPRPFGLCAGEFVVPDDFDAPLPEDILKDFES